SYRVTTNAASLRHHLKVAMLVHHEVALNERTRTSRLSSYHFAAHPRRVGIRCHAIVMHQVSAFRHHHLEVAMPIHHEVALDDAARAGRLAGYDLAPHPRRVGIRCHAIVMHQVCAFEHHHLEVAVPIHHEVTLDDATRA